MTPEAKRKLYESALIEYLMPRIYENGFGTAIPPYDPDQDFLTLNYFGVVTGEGALAYSRLADYDLMTQFIHPAIVRKKGVGVDDLRDKLIPTQTYQYTILSWAKQIALERTRPKSQDVVNQRTFMIVVHDGVPNENSLTEEIEMVRRWAKDNYEKVSPLVSAIDRDYKFTDGQGNNKPAWAEGVRGGAQNAPVFIEAYEVVTSGRAKWEDEGKRLRPLDDLQLRWTKESGDTPEGALTASLSEDFKTWMSSAKSAEVSLAAEYGGKPHTGQGVEVPMVFQRALTCDPKTFKAVLYVSLQQTDQLLGSRTVNYATAPNEVVAPLPTRCTLTYIVLFVVAALLAALLLALLAYYIYYRYFATHLKIEIPGTLSPIPLRRKGKLSFDAPLVPQQGLEALNLRLPSLLKQRLFYRGATIAIGSDGKQKAYWHDGGSDSILWLPVDREYIPAYWATLPHEPSFITIQFRQKGNPAEVSLSYPAGVSK